MADTLQGTSKNLHHQRIKTVDSPTKSVIFQNGSWKKDIRKDYGRTTLRIKIG